MTDETKPEFWKREIWDKREHVCQCCGVPLSYPIRTFYFSHVLSVGSYKVAEKWPENIVLSCFHCHQQWEFGGSTVRGLPKFDGMRLLASVVEKTIYSMKEANLIK